MTTSELDQEKQSRSTNSLDNKLSEYQQSSVQNLTILNFNDWHGYVEPHDGFGGAAHYDYNFQQEGHVPGINDSFILLNAGDFNAGSALTTLSKGEIMIDLMNSMGVDATTIGNHEFDFGIDIMEQQVANSTFPWICANVIDRRTNNLPHGVVPYQIQNHAGIEVGITGLITTYSANSLHPAISQDLDFLSYEDSLRLYVPEMKSQGAQVIIALTHIQPSQLVTLAENTADLNIDVFIGGHNEGSFNQFVENSLVISAEHRGLQYGRIDIMYDLQNNQVTEITANLKDNLDSTIPSDPDIENIITYWRDVIDPDQIISYTSMDIMDDWPDSGIGDLVADSFLDYFRWTNSFSVAGRGSRAYFWDNIYAGQVTLEDVVNVAKREFNLTQISMTGAQIMEMIIENHGSYTYGGLRYNYSQDPDFALLDVEIWDDGDFVTINQNSSYSGLMLDIIWWRDFHGLFSGFDTGVHQREAVLNYFSKLTDLSVYTRDGRVKLVEITTDQTPVSTSNSSTQSSTSSNQTSQLSLLRPTSVWLSSLILGIMILSIVSYIRYKRLPNSKFKSITK